MNDYKKVNGFGVRLKEEREKAKLSRADVGNMLGGVAISTLQAWEAGTREPPISKLMELANILKVSTNYLLMGETEEPNEKGIVSGAFKQLEKSRPCNNNVEELPLFSSINVSAGFGSFNEGTSEPDEFIPYAKSLLNSLGIKPTQCGVFKASGNSMEPTISNGSYLLVDFNRKTVNDNNIYLVQNGSSIWVKRVKMQWNSVELISDNKEEYKPIVITANDVQNLQIIGQVVHIGQSLI